MADKVRKFNTIVSRRELWTIRELVDSKIYLDLSFQSIDRWDDDHKTNYSKLFIKSMFILVLNPLKTSLKSLSAYKFFVRFEKASN